jgi:hypothetical protein
MIPEIPPPAFALETGVRVRPGERNRTPREGTIRKIVWHYQDECYYYFLEQDGKKVSKRYREEDLQTLNTRID